MWTVIVMLCVTMAIVGFRIGYAPQKHTHLWDYRTEFDKEKTYE